MNKNNRFNFFAVFLLFLLLYIPFVISVEINWYTSGGFSFYTTTCSDTRTVAEDSIDVTCASTPSTLGCSQEGTSYIEFDFTEEGTNMQDCRLNANPYTCQVSGNGYGKLYVKYRTVDWDANQPDCECYGKTWLAKVSGSGNGNCCGDDAGESYQGIGYSACINGVVVGDGDSSSTACEGGVSGAQGNCDSDNEGGCWAVDATGTNTTKCCGDDADSDDFCNGAIGSSPGACFDAIYRTNADYNPLVCECVNGTSRWAIGGEVAANTCCGNGPGEYKKMKVVAQSGDISGFSNDPNDDACCNDNFDWVDWGCQ